MQFFDIGNGEYINVDAVSKCSILIGFAFKQPGNPNPGPLSASDLLSGMPAEVTERMPLAFLAMIGAPDDEDHAVILAGEKAIEFAGIIPGASFREITPEEFVKGRNIELTIPDHIRDQIGRGY